MSTDNKKQIPLRIGEKLYEDLLKWAEEGVEPTHSHEAVEVEGLACPNKKCICNNENVDYKFHLTEGGVYRCLYCSTKAK